MPKLEFNNTAGVSDRTFNENDHKIDISDLSYEDIEQQEKFLESLTDNDPLNSFNEDIADTSGEDDDESEESDDEEEDEADDEDSESDDDETPEKGDESKTEDEADENQANESLAGKGKYDGYETFEEYKESFVKPLQQKSGDYSSQIVQEPANDFNATIEFLKKNSDIIPESTVDNYRKFGESENNAFVHGDNHLYKLSKAIESINTSLPYSKRLEYAFELAFKDDIIKRAQKTAQANAEIRTQRVNKAVGRSSSNESKGSESRLSAEQLNVFKKMGVKVPKKLIN